MIDPESGSVTDPGKVEKPICATIEDVRTARSDNGIISSIQEPIDQLDFNLLSASECHDHLESVYLGISDITNNSEPPSNFSEINSEINYELYITLLFTGDLILV